MRKQSFIAVFFAAAALLLVMCTSASAQVESPLLDGQWFKLQANGRGYSVGMDETVKRWHRKFDAYMYIGTDFEVFYYYFLVCEVAPGLWVPVIGDELFVTEAGKLYFLSDTYFEFYDPDGSFIINYATAVIKTKTNRFGELKKAKFKSIGSEVVWGIDGSDNSTLFGRAKIKGKLIDEEDLPFDLDNETHMEPRPDLL